MQQEQPLLGELGYRFDLRVGDGRCVVMAYGAGGTVNGPADLFLDLTDALRDRGIGSCAFTTYDPPEYDSTTLAIQATQVTALVELLERLGVLHIGLVGESLGAAAVVLARCQARACALLWPALNPGDVRLASYRLPRDISARMVEMTQPVLVIHGTDDQDVPLEQGLWAVAQLPRCTMRLVEGGDHGLKNGRGRAQALTEIADFFQEHLR